MAHTIGASVMVGSVGQGEQSSLSEDANESPTSSEEPEPEQIPDPLETLTKYVSFRVGNEFSPIRDPLADTAVYFGIPARIPGQDAHEHKHVCHHFDTIHLVRSTTLKTLGSSKIENLFKPNACIRAEKKFKKLDAYGRLNSTARAQIKYHINLQPSQDGDEAALLIMSLSCARGILNWHLASQVYDLSPNSVAGVDHFDTARNPYFMDMVRARQGPAKIALPVVDEYCPVRHHSALERLLNAVQGNDPKLDSAPKMWTYFAVAQHLGCANHVKVNRWILEWFNSRQNPQFIQNNPEIAYRIGMECQWSEFARDAFAILVGEKALADAVGQLLGQVASSTRSVHGRPLEILDDDERNRIGHAASSLIARTQALINNLAVVVDWLPKSPEYAKLLDFQPHNEDQQRVIQNAKSAIRNFAKRRILEYLLMRLEEVHEELYACLPDTVLPHAKHPISFLEAYNNLPRRARIFTRSFWLGLCQINFQFAPNDTHFSFPTVWERGRNVVDSDPILGNIDFSDSNNFEKVASEVQLANDLIRMSFSAPDSVFYGAPSQLFAPCHLSAPSGKQSAASASLTGASDVESEGIRDAGLEEKWDTNLEPLLKDDQDSTAHGSSSSGKRPRTAENDLNGISLPVRSLPENENNGFSSSVDNPPTDVGADHGRFYPGVWYKKSFFRTKDSGVSAKARELKRQGHSIKQIEQKLSSGSDPWGGVEDYWNDQPAAKVTKLGPPPAPGRPPSSTHFRYVNGVLHTYSPAPTAPLPITNPDAVPSSPPTRRVMQQFSDIPAPPSPAFAVHDQPFTCTDRTPTSTETFLRTKTVDLQTMYREFSNIVRRAAQEVVYPPHLFHGRNPVPINLIDFVIALSDEEWKFLPLWAGGCDDGSGGVFDSTIPNVEGGGGFRGGKRGMGRGNVGDGENTESVSSKDSGFENVDHADALSSTARASHEATDGIDGTMKSFDSASETSSDFGFMNQDDVFDVIREMKAQQAVKEAATGNGQDGIAAGNGVDGDIGDGDDSTVMGARSMDEDDVQGDFFGGDDDDDDNEIPDGDHCDEDDDVGFEDDDDCFVPDVKGKGKADYAPTVESVDSSDSEMEVVDKDHL